MTWVHILPGENFFSAAWCVCSHFDAKSFTVSRGKQLPATLRGHSSVTESSQDESDVVLMVLYIQY